MPIIVASPYAEASATVRKLPAVIADDRLSKGLSITAQAKLIGVSSTTLTRLATGSVPAGSTILLCLDYLAR